MELSGAIMIDFLPCKHKEYDFFWNTILKYKLRSSYPLSDLIFPDEDKCNYFRRNLKRI
jgi:hypothetical protein